MTRLAKIVATLGPGTQDPDIIRQILEAGANVIRLNFSHGNHDTLVNVVRHVRQISQELRLPVAIFGDLQGPKFRIGELENHSPVFLEKGNQVRFSASSTPGNQTHLTTNTPQIIEELNPGDTVLLDDGLMTLQVIDRLSQHELLCEVTTGGILGEKKGINVPGLKMANIPALTEKDKADALFALEQDLDFLALSFVRSYKDILYLRKFLADHVPANQTPPLIIAKIEKPQALDELDAIIDATDAIMVARGDLGVELRPERVPIIQKMIINKANLAEKPVITATQMLESMIHYASPTRAEVSDVANAVFDGSDALMLSGETAVGKYPVDAVRTMSRIIEEAESHYTTWHHRMGMGEVIIQELAESDKTLKFHEAIAQAACFAAKKAHTQAIVSLSFSGRMARRLSKSKPQIPIIALTPSLKVYRQLNLLLGVYPLKLEEMESTEETLFVTEKTIADRGLLKKGDPVVFCAGQTHLPGVTNTLKIYRFGEILEQHQLSGVLEQQQPSR